MHCTFLLLEIDPSKIHTCTCTGNMTCLFRKWGGTYNLLDTLRTKMAAFQGINVLPAKQHVTTKKEGLPDRHMDRQTDTVQRDPYAPIRGKGSHPVFRIGPKNTNLVEDAEILLPVKFS